MLPRKNPGSSFPLDTLTGKNNSFPASYFRQNNPLNEVNSILHRHIVSLLTLITVLSGCIKTESSDGQRPSDSDQVTLSPERNRVILSFSGEQLPPKSFEGQERQKRMQQLEEARTRYENYPDSLEAVVWYGRRLGYMGQYFDAIEVYTQGLVKFTNSYELLRHRGEAYITVRKFDKGRQDLEQAVFFSRNTPNELEPDGQPNRLNKPLRSIKFNIWYHLGLTYYLKGNFDKAISAYRKCMEVSNNNDLKVATTTWLYRTYVQIGNMEEAERLLESIDSEMRLVENRSYHNILMLFKNEIPPERIRELAARRDKSLDPTIGFGLGNWYVLKGEVSMATETFDQVLSSDNWDSFGYIASEVERSNLEVVPL